MEMSNNFAVFILTNNRPDKVYTYNTLKKEGYTGKIYIIIDDEDKTREKYIENFGADNVIIFSKEKISLTFDQFDNFNDRRAIIYARNASFEIAEKLGIKYFVQLDDDYTHFSYRIDDKKQHPKRGYVVKNQLDNIFLSTLNYYKNISAKSIAFSQGGDWFGGENNFNKKPKRKAMNSFFCSTDRKFNFIGRINEDVNTYTSYQSKGNLFFTIPFIQLNQLTTQSNSGGMSELYLDSGTYIKSFYTIICSPNCTKITLMGSKHKRLHHKIKWNNAVPKIIEEKFKKSFN
jgi:hypothetical protein